MAQFTINLPATFAIVSRDMGVEANFEKLSVSMIEKLVLHGITQKVADSAAGAMKGAGFEGRKFSDLSAAGRTAVQAWGKNAMAETLATLESGLWAERKAGGVAVSPIAARVRVLFAAYLRTESKPTWAAIKDADDKNDLLDAMIADLDADVKEYFLNRAEVELAAEAATKTKINALKIKITLPTKK